MSSKQNYDSKQLSERDSELRSLLTDISEGNQNSLKTFYDRTSNMVYGLAMKILKVPEEAEEVVMDIYTNVWNNAHKYNPDRAAPLTWLLMITRSRCIDHIRSNSKRVSSEVKKDDEFISRVESGMQNPEQINQLGDDRKVIKEALGNLSENQRKTIELAYFSGYTQTEIAEELDQPLGTIKSWARLGMIKLREVMVKGGS